MKATAQAPANIAFIKYWGRRDNVLRLPANNSLSVNLSSLVTTTTVEFLSEAGEDEVTLDGQAASPKAAARIQAFLDVVRQRAEFSGRAVVSSENSFPHGVGLASSASGFAALTLAATQALGLPLTEKELSQLARLGSGSACRSIPDGFVEWQTAASNEESYAISLYPPDYWEIVDVIAIVDQTEKSLSSSEGHEAAPHSPFYQARLEKFLPEQYAKILRALDERDFSAFGTVMEEEAINFHAIIMTAQPSVLYWNGATMNILHQVRAWRRAGLEAYFTIDAGPNVHVFCEKKNQPELVRQLSAVPGVEDLMVATPAPGARLITE